jgi:uncharacterized membrane protein YhaH (DUF805 family)
MSPTTAFLSDVALAAITSLGIVVYVKKHLRLLLIELCGIAERANFWLAFSNVTLVLVPIIFALDYKLELGPDKNLVLEMAAQLKHALIGFVITLSILAIVMSRFIPRERTNATSAPPLRG